MEQRFMKKVIKNPETECWEWNAAKNKQGYGMYMGRNQEGKHKSYPAHRYSWMIQNPNEPEPEHVMHMCHNRECVNPNHLRGGSRHENLQMKMVRNPPKRQFKQPRQSLRKWVTAEHLSSIQQVMNEDLWSITDVIKYLKANSGL